MTPVRSLAPPAIDRAQRAIKELRVEWMEDTDHDIPLHRSEALAGFLLDLAARAEGCE